MNSRRVAQNLWRLPTWVMHSLAFCVLALATIAHGADREATVDLPACEASAPGMTEGLALGVVQPYASEHVLAYVARLTQSDPALNVCAETWTRIVPRWVPWASELERLHGFVIFGLAFVFTVTLLWRLTPRQWWRRTTLLGVLGVGLGSWLCGTAFLAAFHSLGGQRMLYGTVVSMHLPQQATPTWFDLAGARELEAVLAKAGALRNTTASADRPTAAALATTVEPASPSSPPVTAQVSPAGMYRVAHRLNVRSGPGVQHPHVITLPRGDDVQFDGAVQGDWWRVRTRAGMVGWSSSLWLRRPGEALPAATEGAPSAPQATPARS